MIVRSEDKMVWVISPHHSPSHNIFNIRSVTHSSPLLPQHCPWKSCVLIHSGSSRIFFSAGHKPSGLKMFAHICFSLMVPCTTSPVKQQYPPSFPCPFKHPGALLMRLFIFVCNFSSCRDFSATRFAKCTLMVGNSSPGFSCRVVYCTGCELEPLILCSGTDFSESMNNLFYLWILLSLNHSAYLLWGLIKETVQVPDTV